MESVQSDNIKLIADARIALAIVIAMELGFIILALSKFLERI